MIPPARLRRGIGTGLVVLVALMPFHAFLSVWLGTLTGHEAVIQAWKEVLLVVLAGAGALLLAQDPESRDRLRTWPVLMAGLFALIAVVVTAVTRPSLTGAVFGAKTDLEFLVAFVLAIIAATPQLVKQITVAVLAAAGLVVAFGLMQVFVLPPNFLTAFGYGPHTIVPYETLDPAVRSLRFASTLGGPNQLGTYLILPLALAGVLALRRRQWWWMALIVAGAVVLIHTYSRAAWLGGVAAVVVLTLVLVHQRLRPIVAAALAAAGIVAAVVGNQLLKSGSPLKHYILHGGFISGPRSSDSQHLASLENGAAGSLAQPLGHGLGAAGPAVFHSGTGLIIENNYLQIAYETGLPGAVVFVLLLAATARELGLRARRHDLAAASLAALVGICITALFLPAWTDSSTALIFWSAAGAIIGLTPGTRHV